LIDWYQIILLGDSVVRYCQVPHFQRISRIESIMIMRAMRNDIMQ